MFNWGISSAAFSHDSKRLAVSYKQDNRIDIYETNGSFDGAKWTKISELTEHSMDVTVLSWSKDGRLLSGSYDRNAYIWDFRNGKFRPTLISLMNNERGITAGEWAPTIEKFCLSNATKHIMVGYYYKEDKCWETDKLKRFKSTVVSLAFHQSGRVLAVGSMNQRFYLISSYLVENSDLEDSKYNGLFSSVKTYGEILYDVGLDGWIESIAWSPEGKECSVAAHNSTLSTIYWTNSQFEKIETTKLKNFPLTKILYKNNNELVGGGYDKIPMNFKKNGKVWEMSGTYEKGYEGCKMAIIRRLVEG